MNSLHYTASKNKRQAVGYYLLPVFITAILGQGEEKSVRLLSASDKTYSGNSSNSLSRCGLSVAFKILLLVASSFKSSLFS